MKESTERARRMKRTSILTGILSLAAVVGAVSAWGVTALPYVDGFESGALSNVWDANTSQASVTISNSALNAALGDYFLHMADGDEQASASITVTGNHSNVWWLGYAKVKLQTTGTQPSAGDLGDSRAAFFVEESGHIWAYTGGWTQATSQPIENTNDWLGFAVHLDYAADSGAGQWDLYLTKDGVDTTLDRLNATPLAMAPTNDATPGFDLFKVTGDTSLDVVGLSAGSVQLANSPSAIKPKVTSAVAGVWIADRVPVHGFPDPTDNRLGGAAGELLKEGMRDGDKVKVYQAGWKTYKLVDGAWEWDGAVEDAIPLGNIVLHPNASLWKYYDSVDLPQQMVFYADTYNPDAVASQTYAPPTGTLTLTTTNGSIAAGWNSIIWTSTQRRSLAGAGLTPATGVPDLPDGAVCFTIPRNSGRWYRSQYNQSTGKWERYGNDSSDEIDYGEQIWIFVPKSGVGTIDWDIGTYD